MNGLWTTQYQLLKLYHLYVDITPSQNGNAQFQSPHDHVGLDAFAGGNV